jgi:hypothetical protein
LTDASELVFGRAGDSIHTCCSRTGSVCVCVSAETSTAPLVTTARVALRRADRAMQRLMLRGDGRTVVALCHRGLLERW